MSYSLNLNLISPLLIFHSNDKKTLELILPSKFFNDARFKSCQFRHCWSSLNSRIEPILINPSAQSLSTLHNHSSRPHNQCVAQSCQEPIPVDRSLEPMHAEDNTTVTELPSLTFDYYTKPEHAPYIRWLSLLDTTRYPHLIRHLLLIFPLKLFQETYTRPFI